MTELDLDRPRHVKSCPSAKKIHFASSEAALKKCANNGKIGFYPGEKTYVSNWSFNRPVA